MKKRRNRKVTLLRDPISPFKEYPFSIPAIRHLNEPQGFPDASIYNLDKGRIQKIDYEATSHYSIIKYFLENRENV